jgi:hypothetical protein
MGKIEIPKDFMGVPVSEKTLKETLSSRGSNDSGSSDKRGHNVSLNPNLDGREYIQIPQHGNIVIATDITYKNKNWRETLDALNSDGLFMPRIDHFMTHFMNVRKAVDGGGELVYADGTPVSDDKIKEVWRYISSTDRDGIGVCWTWLDALFVNKSGVLKLETDHMGSTGNGANLYDLEAYASSSGWAELDFNRQGLPTKGSGLDRYSRGENIYFWEPQDGRVARFVADSGRAVLYCYWVPDDRDTSLGVFACAEGAARKNSGGSN